MDMTQEEQKRLLIAVIPVLALFGYWYFLHQPAAEEIAGMESRLETLETQNAQARATAQQAGPELEDRLAVYEQHMIRLEQLMPSSEEVPELLESMALRAEQANIDLALVRPEPSEAGQFYRRRTYEIRVVGGYHEIGRFLAEIGSLARIVTPIDLQVTAVDDSNEAATAEAEFRIETYVLPEATDTGEVETDARSS